MDVTVQSYKRADLVQASGRIDSSTAGDFEAALKELAKNGRHHTVVDLSGVEYMSSAGLRALVGALRENKRHDGNLLLAAPSQRVREVLTLAGLESVFELYDDVTAAIGSY